MSKSHFKCKRATNDLRYLYRELELIEETVEFITPIFLKYYQDFCRNHDINPQNGPPGTDIPFVNEDQESPTSGSLSHNGAPAEYYNDEFGNWHIMHSDQDQEAPTELEKIFRKLFKNIALYLHPDRISADLSEKEKVEHLKMFKKALDAFENKHYFRLVTIAEKFGIETPVLGGKQLKWLKAEIKTVRAKISSNLDTYNYQFSECETTEQKEQLMKSFVMQNFNIEV